MTGAREAIYTGSGASIVQNADGKRYNQSFRFEGVEEGSYKLAVYKNDNYIPVIQTITVAGSDLSLGELEMWIYGDLDRNGSVNANDALDILKSAAKLQTFTELQEQAADVNLDGQVNASDALAVLKYAAKLITSFR